MFELNELQMLLIDNGAPKLILDSFEMETLITLIFPSEAFHTPLHESVSLCP